MSRELLTELADLVTETGAPDPSRVRLCEFRRRRATNAGVGSLWEDATQDLRCAFARFILRNDHDVLVKRREALVRMAAAGEQPTLLDVSAHSKAYRFLDQGSPEALARILGVEAGALKRPEGYQGGIGSLTPWKTTLSSWTVNPRSLVFSGYFSVIPEGSSLALYEAPIRGAGNAFVGNPDSLAAVVGLDNGYALEREVLAFGPVSYTRVVAGSLRPGQSLEGLAADLIERLWRVRDVTWNDAYYFPQLRSGSGAGSIKAACGVTAPLGPAVGPKGGRK